MRAGTFTTVYRITWAAHSESTVANAGLKRLKSSERLVTRRNSPLKRRLAGKSNWTGARLTTSTTRSPLMSCGSVSLATGTWKYAQGVACRSIFVSNVPI